MVVDVPDLAAPHRATPRRAVRAARARRRHALRPRLRVEQQLRALLGQEDRPHRAPAALVVPALHDLGAARAARSRTGGAPRMDRRGRVEVLVARGRSASTPRRVKARHRELLKLDIVEARLSEAGADEASRLDALADDTADALANYIGRLPARTLVMVFGDHGFPSRSDRGRDGEGAPGRYSAGRGAGCRRSRGSSAACTDPR